jgi:hypothetical protein
MPIAWTKTTRKKLSAVRHPHKADPTDLTHPSGEAAWGWLRARRAKNAAAGCVVTATEGFAPYLDVVLADYARDTLPLISDPVTELTRAVAASFDGSDCYPMMTQTWRALVALWMTRGGPALVADLLSVTAPFAFSGSFGMASSIRLEPLEPNPYGHKALVRLVDGANVCFEAPFWFALRAWLFAADAKTYADAFAAFTPCRLALCSGDTDLDAAAAGRARSYMSFAFSRDPVWATEDARLALQQPNQHIPLAELLLASLTDPALALSFVQSIHINAFSVISRGYDVIESLGSDAASVLDAFGAQLGSVRPDSQRKLDSLLKLART